MKHLPRHTSLLLIIGSFLIFGLQSVLSADFPTRADTYVNDNAGIIDADTTSIINGLLAELKSSQSIDMTVLTIDRISDYTTTSTTLEQFATRLFNTWGIGDAATNKGILLLVARGDRKVRLELGSGFDDSYNRRAQTVIDEHILPAFRNDNYDEGIEAGVRAAIYMLTGTWPTGTSPMLMIGQNTVNQLLVAGGVGLGVAGLGAWWYFRHRCPQCGKSTLNIQSNVIQHATYSSQGEKEVTRTCYDCGFNEVQYIAIAMLTHSDDSSDSGGSSSSSGGGGSSSGGGASGSW